MTDYADIIRRLTEAAGPGRDLDWEVYASSGLEGVGMYGAHPEYTASLDASIALCELMLPGWAKGFDDGPETHLAFVDPHDHELRITGARYTATAKSPAIALLISMFRALAQSKAGE